MASVTTNTYPTSDGKPMAETDWHRDLMLALIQVLKVFYARDPMVYVSGNLLIFYVPGNRRRHLAPDVFVVKGVPSHDRPNYLTWEEGKCPDVVIELTSSSTRAEDVKRKYLLYQNTLKVREYFLFDPLGDYLDPPLQGFRLRKGVYEPIRFLKGRLPSRVLGLHLEHDGRDLRLYDPASKEWLPTSEERVAQAEERVIQAEERVVQTREQVVQAEERAVQAEGRVVQAREQVVQTERENERLRRELNELRRRLPPTS
jgi:Uma2 family endonuclease